MAVSLVELDRVDKEALVDSRGRSFRDFRRALTPRYVRVWCDIAVGYLALGAVILAMAELDGRFPWMFPLTASVGAVALGYWIAYVQLFLHEAAHYNIAKNRRLNDFVANLFIGLMVGQSVQKYRIVHFDHHRLLGTPEDTERSYFDPLDARFFIEGLTGIKLLRVMARRGRRVRSEGNAEAGGRGFALAGLAANALLVGFALTRGWYSVAVGWCVGMVLVHPLINAVRQLLEHRSFEARPECDYGLTPHGAVTRTFGSGLLASTFGGAGFNRHLLHHWEPQISYTGFGELEAYLLDTAAGDILRRNKSSYGAAFHQLSRQAR